MRSLSSLRLLLFFTLQIGVTFSALAENDLNVDFDDGSIPVGWTQQGNVKWFASSDCLYAKVGDASKMSRGLLKSPVLATPNIDNVCVVISLRNDYPIYDDRIDTIEICATTNSWRNDFLIGKPIPLYSSAYPTNTWVSYTFAQSVEGLAGNENLAIGVRVIAAGASKMYAYLRNIKISYLATAIPENVRLLQPTGETNDVFNAGDVSYVAVDVPTKPANNVAVNAVTATILRNGVECGVLQFTNLVDSCWVSTQTVSGYDVGETLQFRVQSEYSSDLYDVMDGGRTTTLSDAYTVAGKGSVWLNEFGKSNDGNSAVLEIAGSTNRIPYAGWMATLQRKDESGSVYTNKLPTVVVWQNTTNGVGFLTVPWRSDELPNVSTESEEYILKLLNSAGVCEDAETVVFPLSNASVGKAGNLPWPTKGCSWDWTGANELFGSWVNLANNSFGFMNENQGVNVPAEVNIRTFAYMKKGELELPCYSAKVSTTVHFSNGDQEDKRITDDTGWTENLTLTGENAAARSVWTDVSVSSFGWVSDTITTNLVLGSNFTNEVRSLMIPTTAEDKFDSSIEDYWTVTKFNGSYSWVWTRISNDGLVCCTLGGANSGVGSRMELNTSLSPHSKGVAQFSCRSRNTVTTKNYGDIIQASVSTNGVWTDGTDVCFKAFSNYMPEMEANSMVPVRSVIRLPEGYESFDDLRFQLCATAAGRSNGSIYVDDLRVAFQDMATGENLVMSPALPSDGRAAEFSLNIVPWCAANGAVGDVSADLVLVLNGTTNSIPFKYDTAVYSGVYTNNVSEVTTVTISAEDFERGIGRKLAAGDEISYFARVNYFADSRDPDSSKEYEVRYCPDNSQKDADGSWFVIGEYGPKARTFVVPGIEPYWFNEVKRSGSVGTDFIEIAGVTNTSLAGWSLEVKDLASGDAVSYTFPAGAEIANNPVNTYYAFYVLGGGSVPEADLALSSALPVSGGLTLMDPDGATRAVLAWTNSTVLAELADSYNGFIPYCGNGTIGAVGEGNPASEFYSWTEISGGGTPAAVNDGEFMVNRGPKLGIRSVIPTVSGLTVTVYATDVDGVASNRIWLVFESGAVDTEGSDGVATFTGLAPNTRYTVHAKGWDFLGSESESELDAGWTLANVPTAVTVTGMSVDSVAATAKGDSGVEFSFRAGGSAAGWSGWTAVGSWSGAVPGSTPNSEVEVSVKARNGAGVETAAASAFGYTMAAPADAAPEIVKGIDNVTVRAPEGYSSLHDGNPTNTQYAVCVVNGGGSVTNLVDEWRVLEDWGTAVTVSGEYLDFNTTNSFGFVTKNEAGQLAWSDVSTNCFFDMTAKFSAEGMPRQVAEPWGNVAYQLELRDPTQSAALKVEASLDGGQTWRIIHSDDNLFDENMVCITDRLYWNAAAAGAADGAEFRLKATLSGAGREPVVTEIATGTLDFAAPNDLAISGDPANGSTVNETAFSLAATADDNMAITYHWTFNGVSSTGAALTGTAKEGKNTASVYAQDAMGNVCSAVFWSWTVDTKNPENLAISGTPANGAVTNTKEFGFSATAEDATSLMYHWTLGESTATGTEFTGTVDADGEYTVYVYAEDAAGNKSETVSHSWRLDTVAPTVVVSSATPNPFNAEKKHTVVAKFSESVGGFSKESVAVVNAKSCEVSGSGDTYTITVVPETDGDVSVQILANAVTDAAGNKNEASAALVRKYDNTKPTVVLSSSTPSPFNAEKAPMTVVAKFSEAVSGFNKAAVAVGNAKSYEVNGSGDTYTITVLPEADGNVSVQILANAVTDAAGNKNEASAALVRKYDNTKPTVVLSSATQNPFNAEKTLTVVAKFSESVSGFSKAAVAVGNAKSYEVSGDGDTYTITVVPEADGNVSVQILANAVTDAAGNKNEASAALVRKYDNTKPTVELTSVTPSPFNAENAFTVVAKFSESVSGFSEAAVAVVNAMSYEVSGSGDTYTITVVPEADGDVSVQILANAVTDTAGNKNEASAALVRKYDNTKPTVVLSSSTPNPFNADKTHTVIAKFSESVNGFSEAAVAVGNAKSYEVSGSDDTYTITVVPETDGDVSVQILANAVTDAAGNKNEASAALVRKYDNTKPTVTLSSSTPNPFNAEKTLTVIAQFSEAVSGFGKKSVAVINAKSCEVSGSGDTYTITVVPEADGDVSVQVVADVVTDAAGNKNEVSAVLVRKYDNTKPTVELTSVTPNPFNADKTHTVIAKFSESVSGFSKAAVAVGNAMSYEVSGSGDTYTITVVPEADGDVSVQILANAVTDAAGNKNEVSAVLVRKYDNTKPTVELTSVTPNPFNADKTHTVIAKFSESVNGFSEAAVAVGNAKSYEVSGSDDTYTITVVPETDGDVSVQILANAVTDAADNKNEASAALVRKYDNTKPTVVLSSSTPNPFNAENAPMTVVAKFSESVSGFSKAAVAVGNAKSYEVSGDGDTYTITVVPNADGNVSVQVIADAVTDEAGNKNEASAALVRNYDGTKPAVVLASETPSPFSAEETFALTVQFSEAVTNFTAESVSVENGAVSEVAAVDGAENVYTVTIVPDENTEAAGQAVTVLIPAGVVADAAGNGNAASEPLSRTYDMTAPTVTLTSANEVSAESGKYQCSKVKPLIVTVTFSEAVSEFSGDDLDIVNGEVLAVEPSEDGSVYTVTVKPLEVSDVTVTVKAGSAVDAARNENVVSNTVTGEYADDIPPTMTLESSTPDPFNRASAPMVVTAKFSEAVEFTAAAVTAGNAETVVVTGSGDTYTITVTPENEGRVWVAIAERKVFDLAGNANTNSVSLSRTYDITPPKVTVLESETPDPFNATKTFVVTVGFSETVTNFSAKSVTVSNGSVSAVEATSLNDVPCAYTVTVRPAKDGDVAVQILRGAVHDSAGNGNVASEVLVREYDTTPPTVSFNGPVASNKPFELAVRFSEPVSGFASDNLVLVNATAGAVTGSGDLYQVSITPVAEGVVSVKVKKDAVMDMAENANAASDTWSCIYDVTPPNLTPSMLKYNESDFGRIGVYAVATTNRIFSVNVSTTDSGSGIYRYVGKVTAGTVSSEEFISLDGVFTIEALVANAQHTLTVYAEDLAGNQSPVITWSWYYGGVINEDVHFDGGLWVKKYNDREMVITIEESFQSDGVNYRFVLSPFRGIPGESSGLQMWFKVCDRLDGDPWYVKVNDKYQLTVDGKLSVRLPPEALEKDGEKCKSFFIFGVSNKNLSK